MGGVVTGRRPTRRWFVEICDDNPYGATPATVQLRALPSREGTPYGHVQEDPVDAAGRDANRVEGSVVMRDGAVHDINVRAMLQPLERALRTLSWAMVAIALALASARFL
jgi:hypothetical protein